MLVKMKDYLAECPELSAMEMCVNYLAENEGSASIEMWGNRENIREYADGGIMKSVIFTLAIRGSFGLSQPENREISDKCQKIENWVEEQNLKGNLPELEGEMHSVSVGISKCFRIVKTHDFSARYEAQIELIYYRA